MSGALGLFFIPVTSSSPVVPVGKYHPSGPLLESAVAWKIPVPRAGDHCAGSAAHPQETPHAAGSGTWAKRAEQLFCQALCMQHMPVTEPGEYTRGAVLSASASFQPEKENLLRLFFFVVCSFSSYF